MPYKPKIESQSTLSPVYSNMHGKVIYVMSAKLIKHVTVSFSKSLLSESPQQTVGDSIDVEVKEKVIHKKKMKAVEEGGMYEKEYNTTSEYRRFKNLEVVKEGGSDKEERDNGESKDNKEDKENRQDKDNKEDKDNKQENENE